MSVFFIIRLVMTQFTDNQINALSKIFLEDLGLKYTDQELRDAAIKIVHYVVIAEQKKLLNETKEI